MTDLTPQLTAAIKDMSFNPWQSDDATVRKHGSTTQAYNAQRAFWARALQEHEPESVDVFNEHYPVRSELTERGQAMMKKIEGCLHCGACMKKCPYGLNTPKLLEENYEDYKNVLAGKTLV